MTRRIKKKIENLVFLWTIVFYSVIVLESFLWLFIHKYFYLHMDILLNMGNNRDKLLFKIPHVMDNE
jgi:hypothetical protein